METVTRLAERQANSVSAVSTPGPEVARTLSVTASYLLSENGRKACLLVGGDGHAVQQIALQVPANRLHLVSVDKQGVARLKLRPRFEMDGDRGIVRIDAAPLYDAPPTIEELYRAAAKNHELESAYYAERVAQRSKRSDTDRALRESVAEGFLADTEQRAISHPPPSPKRCYVITDHGRLLFDVGTDQGLAKDVPPEAHRRFRADLRAREERNRHDRSEQLALHDEKKRFVADWIAVNGTEEQRTRQAAGVLPMEEAIEAITDGVFEPLGDHRRYTRDGVERLRGHLAQFAEDTSVVVTSADVLVSSENAKTATAGEWRLVREFQAQRPDASVTLRSHRISFKRDTRVPPILVRGILVTVKHGPFTLRREYALDEVTTRGERSVRHEPELA
jgi:cation transport regulator ChaC